MELSYKQKVVLIQYRGRFKTKRLRKKLLKYPERYFKCKNLNLLFKFAYTDIILDLIPDNNSLLKKIAKDVQFNTYHQPVILSFN